MSCWQKRSLRSWGWLFGFANPVNGAEGANSQRNEHAVIGIRASEKFFIARVLTPVTSVNNVVAGHREIFSGFVPNTIIEEEFHMAASTTAGSTRSWATSRWA